MDREEYVERVLRVVEGIPPGRVMSYGAIADAVGTGGPRQVGQVLATFGGPVPWWRVVRADGTPPPCHGGEVSAHYRRESTPLRPRATAERVRVDMALAQWSPQDPTPTG